MVPWRAEVSHILPAPSAQGQDIGGGRRPRKLYQYLDGERGGVSRVSRTRPGCSTQDTGRQIILRTPDIGLTPGMGYTDMVSWEARVSRTRLYV